MAASIPQSAPAAPLAWTTPNGWEQKKASSMRLAQFTIPGANGATAELAVTSFPGDVGGELANVNRWREEAGLEPVQQAASDAVSIGAQSGKLYEFNGAQLSILVGWAMTNGNSYFFKMRGDKAVLTQARPAMIEFLKSIRFQSASPSAPTPAIDTPAPAASALTQPVLQAPAHWKEQAGSAMTVKSYIVADDTLGKATVTLTTLAGKAGGSLANVNRWRSQAGLEPVTEAQLTESTKTVDAAGAKGTLVDLTGKDSDNHPIRLLAIMAPRGESVWFIKMTGAPALVQRETTNLLELARTARLP